MKPLSHSLRELLADRLDYAGLFPPAGLSMESAFRNYVVYQRHEHSWLLGRFVCPTGRLSELSGLIEQWPDESPLRLSVVVRPSTDADRIAHVAAEFGLINAFQIQHRERVRIESIETTFAPEVFSLDESGIAEFLCDVRQQVEAAELHWLTLFFEPPPVPDLVGVIAVAARACVSASSEDRQLGLKLRLGWADSNAIPTASEVAQFLIECRDAGCQWKATAGLHHPLAGHDECLQTRWHGFLSLFAAVALAEAHHLSVPEVELILTESQADSFHFDESSFAWRHHSVSNRQIAAARRSGLRSFGSCSFDEPVAGLLECCGSTQHSIQEELSSNHEKTLRR